MLRVCAGVGVCIQVIIKKHKRTTQQTLYSKLNMHYERLVFRLLLKMSYGKPLINYVLYSSVLVFGHYLNAWYVTYELKVL